VGAVVVASPRGAAGGETMPDVVATLVPVGTGVDVGVAPCNTTSCCGRAAEGVGGAEVLVATALVAAPDACGSGAAAGCVAASAFDVTTVVDLSVVVQELDVVGGVDEVPALAVAKLPCPDGALEPVGPTGVTGGGTCFAGVVAVPGTVRVVSGRAVAVLAALRTLSAGMAGEPDRTVARRTCSIIAVRQQGEIKYAVQGQPFHRTLDGVTIHREGGIGWCCATEFSRSDLQNARPFPPPHKSASMPSEMRSGEEASGGDSRSVREGVAAFRGSQPRNTTWPFSPLVHGESSV
jgi:hypothetical protein